MEQAEMGLSSLKEHVDALVSIPNERLKLISTTPITLMNAFQAADDVLRQGVQSISDVYKRQVISLRAKDKFGAMLAAGLTVQVGLQAALNIAVVTNTIPNTGISMPFFSYGGTALLMLLAQMGIVLSVSRSTAMEKE